MKKKINLDKNMVNYFITIGNTSINKCVKC